jgi:hypothetical protein
MNIPKETFEVADSTKRTIYLANSDGILSKIDKLMEKNFGKDRSDGVNLRTFDNEVQTPPRKALNTSWTSNSVSTPGSDLNKSTDSISSNYSSPSIVNRSVDSFKTPTQSPFKTPSSNSSRVSLFQDSPIINQLNQSKRIDSDSDDDDLVEFQLSQSESSKNVNVKKENESNSWKPKNTIESVSSVHTPSPMRFSRHYIQRSSSEISPTEEIEQASTPSRIINNLLNDPQIDRIYSSEKRPSFSQEQITPSFSQEQITPRYDSKPKESSPLQKDSLKRKQNEPSPQDEKRRKYEQEKKQESEKNDEIFLNVKMDNVLEGYLNWKEKSKQKQKICSKLTKREESKLEDFFKVDKSSLVNTSVLGNIKCEDREATLLLLNQKVNEKELISIFAYDPIFIDKNLFYYNLMQTHQIPCQVLESPINLSNHPKITKSFQHLLRNPFLKYVFKSNGFGIVINQETKDIELHGLPPSEIIPAYGVDDLVDLMNNLSFFESQELKIIESGEEKEKIVKKNLGYLRNYKVKNYLRKYSKSRVAPEMSQDACEEQILKLSKCESISEFSTRNMFHYLNSIKKFEE